MKGKKILILGAGGVVPSIVFALKNMDVSEIVVSNRTIDKAQNLKILFELGLQTKNGKYRRQAEILYENTKFEIW